MVVPSATFSLGHEEADTQPEPAQDFTVDLWDLPKGSGFPADKKSLVRFCLAHKNECLQPLLPDRFSPKCVIR